MFPMMSIVCPLILSIKLLLKGRAAIFPLVSAAGLCPNNRAEAGQASACHRRAGEAGRRWVAAERRDLPDPPGFFRDWALGGPMGAGERAQWNRYVLG